MKSGSESCGIVAPPHTVSVSYLQDESTVTAAFAQRQCSEYAKVGSRADGYESVGVNRVLLAWFDGDHSIPQQRRQRCSWKWWRLPRRTAYVK